MDKVVHLSPLFEVRPIKAIDLYKFCEILMEAARWFEDHGEVLWDRQQIVPHTILAHYRIDELYLAYVDHKPIGAMIFNNHCYWPQISVQERRDSLFIHKLAISRKAAGMGYSAMMLDWACQQSYQQGYRQLMLMCNCHQLKLRRLWQTYGFKEVEIINDEGNLCHYYMRQLDWGESVVSSQLNSPTFSRAEA